MSGSLPRQAAALLCGASVLALAACGRAPHPSPSDPWATRAQDYSDATEAWTRSGKILSDYDSLLRVSATFKSPQWRAAHVERVARRRKLAPGQHARLVQEQKEAAAAYHEFALLMATYHRRDNDLQKGKRSIWQLALIDDTGAQVGVANVRRDRRSDGAIAADFPHATGFDEAYLVYFPASLEILRPGWRQFSVNVSGPYGAAQLTWRSR